MTNLSHFKEKLETERALVIKELTQIGVVKNKKNPDDWEATPQNIDTTRSDPNEVADRIESYEGNTALVQELDGRLAEIDAALEKIKNNSYGVCEIGGEKIEEDRLEANPAAKTCKKHM